MSVKTRWTPDVSAGQLLLRCALLCIYVATAVGCLEIETQNSAPGASEHEAATNNSTMEEREESSDNSTKDEDEEPGNTSMGEEEEQEGPPPAYLFVNRVRTGFARTNYISILPDLEAREIDLDAAVEVFGPSRFRIYDGDVFVFEGETGEVARYEVAEDLSLEEVGRFSMAGEGVQGFFYLSIAFLSPERAYYVDPAQGRVILWNPQAMEITNTLEVPDLVKEDYPVTTVGLSKVVGEYVVTPVSWRTSNQSRAIYESVLLVLSATDDEVVTIARDARCGVSSTGIVHDGAYYILGDWDGGVYSVLRPDEGLPEPCMLRWQPGAQEFDPDYELELTDVVGAPHFSGAFGMVDTKFVVRAYDSDLSVEEIPDEINSMAPRYFDLELWRWAVVDIEAQTATILDDLPLTGVGFNPAVIDGVFYVPQIDEETQNSTLIAIDGTATSESVRATGDIVTVGRIR